MPRLSFHPRSVYGIESISSSMFLKKFVLVVFLSFLHHFSLENIVRNYQIMNMQIISCLSSSGHTSSFISPRTCSILCVFTNIVFIILLRIQEKTKNIIKTYYKLIRSIRERNVEIDKRNECDTNNMK